ncbi:MAG: tryptophan--tRNA ligase [Candidatus Sungbacteria bacterium]|uniref:Tryptophan--tRNA ligase n=1 Tax=Candidatus Sungiibacteriota bacterium TaxID=2750080 RepID=A0A932QZ31_9BACT|nr:tryptophan--tRNA ligase [Candidatus Sungbacteria bacterium]
MKNKILFSGIQPSGVLHIGNYLGAIKQWMKLQESFEPFFCVVDEHAITVPQEPEELRQNTLNTAMMYMAAGIDPKKSTIFVQSHVPAHAELGWILNTTTSLGELERMTQFKDKREQQSELYAGLLNYLVLMAADILLYQTDAVPVGEDQRQHIELTRSLAKRFNNRFGQTFKIPEGFIPQESSRIMGLDDPAKKMSKSAASPNNYISLLDEPDEIRRKIKIAVTDSGSQIIYDEEKKPAIANLMRIFGAFSEATMDQIATEYRHKTYADFKQDLGELLVEKLSPLQRRYQEFSAEKKTVFDILHRGAEHANAIARKTLRDVQNKIGFLAI